ncbi:coagulation factor XI-like isoform X1 [Anguilla anguilla]|uniref:coagulation factor XI-like isoform X1 n=1 Tax=Anguilla anguilla TaxID=7936 RepID=UPI0015B33918|nr:coagulation factor XI-like isoform X1 [Anguilla anguilla]XP_035284042.1 coagulation factor XI-like isoform X1 [Anguilla anguilla]
MTSCRSSLQMRSTARSPALSTTPASFSHFFDLIGPRTTTLLSTQGCVTVCDVVSAFCIVLEGNRSHSVCLWSFSQFYCYLKHTDSKKPPKINNRKGITSGYSLKTCKDRKRQTCLSAVYNDVDFWGDDYTSLYVADYEDCQMACTKDPGCQFFSFTNQHFETPQHRNRCWLKHTRVFPSPPKLLRLNWLTSGFSHRICTGSSTEGNNCPYKLQTDTNFPGYDFEQVPSPSPEYCQFLCTIHPRCTFYSYTRMVCYLKNAKDGWSHASKEGVTSGYPTRFCKSSDECVRTSYENIDFRGADTYSIAATSSQSCQEACTSDPDCHFYTYVYRGECFLKQVITVPVPSKVVIKKGVVSGFHLRDC